MAVSEEPSKPKEDRDAEKGQQEEEPAKAEDNGDTSKPEEHEEPPKAEGVKNARKRKKKRRRLKRKEAITEEILPGKRQHRYQHKRRKTEQINPQRLPRGGTNDDVTTQVHDKTDDVRTQNQDKTNNVHLRGWTTTIVVSNVRSPSLNIVAEGAIDKAPQHKHVSNDTPKSVSVPSSGSKSAAISRTLDRVLSPSGESVERPQQSIRTSEGALGSSQQRTSAIGDVLEETISRHSPSPSTQSPSVSNPSDVSKLASTISRLLPSAVPARTQSKDRSSPSSLGGGSHKSVPTQETANLPLHLQQRVKDAPSPSTTSENTRVHSDNLSHKRTVDTSAAVQQQRPSSAERSRGFMSRDSTQSLMKEEEEEEDEDILEIKIEDDSDEGKKLKTFIF